MLGRTEIGLLAGQGGSDSGMDQHVFPFCALVALGLSASQDRAVSVTVFVLPSAFSSGHRKGYAKVTEGHRVRRVKPFRICRGSVLPTAGNWGRGKDGNRVTEGRGFA